MEINEERTSKTVDNEYKEFWKDIKFIMTNLNSANSKFMIVDSRDITVSQFLMWKLLKDNANTN